LINEFGVFIIKKLKLNQLNTYHKHNKYLIYADTLSSEMYFDRLPNELNEYIEKIHIINEFDFNIDKKWYTDHLKYCKIPDFMPCRRCAKPATHLADKISTSEVFCSDCMAHNCIENMGMIRWNTYDDSTDTLEFCSADENFADLINKIDFIRNVYCQNCIKICNFQNVELDKCACSKFKEPTSNHGVCDDCGGNFNLLKTCEECVCATRSNGKYWCCNAYYISRGIEIYAILCDICVNGYIRDGCDISIIRHDLDECMMIKN